MGKILSDYTVILKGEEQVGFGTGPNPAYAEAQSWKKRFGTGGRDAERGALLTFSARGLANTQSYPQIYINGQYIGQIDRRDDSLFTQTIVFDGHFLKREDHNMIEITSPLTTPGSGEGAREDFYIKDVVCFFHQET